MSQEVEKVPQNNNEGTTEQDVQQTKVEDVKEEVKNEEFNLESFLNEYPEKEALTLLPEDYISTLKGKSKEEVEAQLSKDVSLIRKIQETQNKKLEQLHNEWINQTKNDPEIGLAKFDESIQIARRGLKAFAPQVVVDFLNETGLGSHPEVVKMFYKLGQLVKDDSLIVSKPEISTSKKDYAELLYNK